MAKWSIYKKVKSYFLKKILSEAYLEEKFSLLQRAYRFKKVRANADKGMAAIGMNWVKAPQVPCVLVFGIVPKERQLVANAIKSCRCAFAFPYTAWIRQCLFILQSNPKAVLVAEDTIPNPVSTQTGKFLERHGIPVLTFSNTQELMDTAPNIQFDALRKNCPAILYGKGWKSESTSTYTMIYYCPSASIMANLVNIFPAEKIIYIIKNLGDIHSINAIFEDFCIKKIVYINTSVSSKLENIRKKYAIPSEVLSDEDLIKILLTPYYEYTEADENKPIAVLLNDKGCTSIAIQMKDYRLFTLNNISMDHLALLSNYTLVWVGEKLPENVKAFAARQSVSTFLFTESLLSRFGYRKTFSTPLFITAEYTEQHACTAEINDPTLLKRARNFRHRLLDIHARLIAKDNGNSPDMMISAVLAGKFSLAVWEAGSGPQTKSCLAFLQAVAAREKGKPIYVLALKAGKAIRLKKTLSLALRNRLIFLDHPKDVDILLPHATRVYAHENIIGFEALLSGKPVVTYGAPWYAGWGLTQDMDSTTRPRSLNLDQLTVLAFFINKSYRAPYSKEKIEPEQALAFWYLRQRQDFARLFEGMQEDFGADPRYQVLDLRANYYNDPEVDEEVAELLQNSVFGHVLADLLMFRAEAPTMQKLLDLFSHDKAIDILQILIIHAYYMLNYELINYMVNEACHWFDRQDMSTKDMRKFYRVYLDGMSKNRFHDSKVPKEPSLRLSTESSAEKICLAYAELLLNAFAYDRFLQFLYSPSDLSASYYLELVKLLYKSSRTTVKEVNIHTRMKLRVRTFRMWEKVRIEEGKNRIPQVVRKLIFSILVEDRERMLEWSWRLKAHCSKKGPSIFAPDVRELIFMTVDMLIANNEAMLASTLLSRLEPEAAPAYAPLQKAMAKKKMTYNRRVTGLESARKKSWERIKSAKKYPQRANLSNTYSLHKHFEKTNAIIAKTRFPKQIKGIIFVGYYGTFFSAILPVVLSRLQERGYAVYPIFNNHIAVQIPKHAPLSQFAYALPNNAGPLQLKWDIDFSARRIMTLKINFYECFFEAIAILIRRYEFNWKDQDVQRFFLNYLKQTDSALAWCHDLYRTAKMAKQKVGILSQFAYSLPESAVRKFVVEQQDSILHYILYKNVANYDLTHSKADVFTKVSAFDMTMYPDCRLSFLPARSRFEPWYAAKKDTPEFIAQIENIKQELRDAKYDSGGALIDRLRTEKAAGKRIILCIGRLLFDQALHKDGGPGHNDMGDWLRHSVEIAAETPDLILLVRPHPHEENPMASVRARQTMRDILPEKLPDNILYLDPLETNVQALVGVMDLSVLWLGTAAYELTALGEPVALCSYAGYDQTPFDTLYPQSREEYAQLLKRKVYPKPDAETQNRGAASLLYIRTTDSMKEYPYAYVRGSNSFRTIPYYNQKHLEKYFSDGDPKIDALADQILEGFEKKHKLLERAL